ncbi:peroxisome biogenesis factor 10-like [Gigantopelta aegis]|uniref:peroxisome biogenesis factor 10-like n=1 Tax=Gigantopelta aegis TaxID=1735272 RepID=UPI001B887C0E|nr:peroxisome biogenesis factor 10-like [Gigantopelta aegis]
MFKRAGIPEIIRSHQKDDFYLNFLRSSVTDIAQTLAGPRRWIYWRRELDVLADLGYFLLTTFSGLQTVGEEYVNIIQVDGSLRKLPVTWKRVLMITLHVLGPYALRRVLENLERHLQTASLDVSEESQQFLLRSIPVLKHMITILHRSHLAVFYLHGAFYHLAKRISGVHYIQYMSHQRTTSNTNRTFQILGWLSLAQLAGSLVLQLYTLWKLQQKTVDQTDASALSHRTSELNVVPPVRKCSLCLESRRSTTTTPCGHLFCWACIHEWCQTKAECPLCRERFPPHRLVCLVNFDPT